MDITIQSVLGQVINFAILFFLFKKFLTKPISKAIINRRVLIKKLESADKAYEQKILEAKQENDKLVQEGLNKKENLIAEAGILANKRREEILKEARIKADTIIEDSKSKAKNLENDLQNKFIDGVKKTSLLVLKKLFNKDKEIQSKYIDEVVSDIVK